MLFQIVSKALVVEFLIWSLKDLLKGGLTEWWSIMPDRKKKNLTSTILKQARPCEKGIFVWWCCCLLDNFCQRCGFMTWGEVCRQLCFLSRLERCGSPHCRYREAERLQAICWQAAKLKAAARHIWKGLSMSFSLRSGAPSTENHNWLKACWFNEVKH